MATIYEGGASVCDVQMPCAMDGLGHVRMGDATASLKVRNQVRSWRDNSSLGGLCGFFAPCVACGSGGVDFLSCEIVQCMSCDARLSGGALLMVMALLMALLKSSTTKPVPGPVPGPGRDRYRGQYRSGAGCGWRTLGRSSCESQERSYHLCPRCAAVGSGPVRLTRLCHILRSLEALIEAVH